MITFNDIQEKYKTQLVENALELENLQEGSYYILTYLHTLRNERVRFLNYAPNLSMSYIFSPAVWEHSNSKSELIILTKAGYKSVWTITKDLL